MRKLSLLTAVLLLSCAWAVAQTSPSSNPSSTQPSSQSPSATSPSSTSPSAAPSSQQPDSSATGTSSDKGSAIEGCLNGSAGNFTLTDASGTTYQLAGDTTKLSDHVGHQVRVWGDSASSGGSSATGSTTSSASSQPTLNVKRVKMISSSCSTK